MAIPVVSLQVRIVSQEYYELPNVPFVLQSKAIVCCLMLSVTNSLFARWQIPVVQFCRMKLVQNLKLTKCTTSNIFPCTTFRERSSLMPMCLRYDKVSANRSSSGCSNLLVHVLHSQFIGVYSVFTLPLLSSLSVCQPAVYQSNWTFIQWTMLYQVCSFSPSVVSPTLGS